MCKLNQSLYGLKQTPRAWYQKLSSFLSTLGFIRSNASSSLFLYKHGSNTYYLLVYMDDVIITGNNSQYITSLIDMLSQAFSLCDLGLLCYFLAIQVKCVPHGITLS